MHGTFGKIVKYADCGGDHPFTVYMAINKTTGASYIGATQKGTKGREYIHRYTARTGRNGAQLIYRAMRKYGDENFTFVTIKECSDWWDALESERVYIAMFKPRYNMTDGGGGVKGHRHSDASKAKMSAAKKGKPSVWTKTPMPQEIREKLAAARRLEKGRPLSPESRAELLKNSKIANAVRRKAVICLTDGKEYESVSAAGRAYSLTSGQVCRLCTLGVPMLTGLRFAYKEVK